MSIDYIDIEFTSVDGTNFKEKLYPDSLPDVYTSNTSVELFEFYYSSQGNGYRTEYSHKPTSTLTFKVGTGLAFSALLKDKLHKHDYFELILVISDELEMQIESKFCKFKKWDICILNPSTRHAELFKQEVNIFFLTLSSEYLLNWPIEANLNMLNNFLLSKFLSKGLGDTYQQNKDYIVARYTDKTIKTPIYGIMKAIKKEFQDKQPGYQFFIRGLVYRLFTILADPTSYKTNYISLGLDSGFPLAFSVKQLLDKSNQRMCIQDVAELLNYSGEHANRIFKNHYGQTIPEYSKMICIRYAALLLRSTTQDIHIICKQLGFVNRTHFYNLFKQQYGCTPAKYRKKVIKNQI